MRDFAYHALFDILDLASPFELLPHDTSEDVKVYLQPLFHFSLKHLDRYSQLGIVH